MKIISGDSAVRTKQRHVFPVRQNNTPPEVRIIELSIYSGKLLISLHPPGSSAGDKILIPLSSIKPELNKQGTNTIILGTSATGRNQKELELIQNEEDIYLFIHPEGTYETGWAAITQKAPLIQAINELT